MKWRLPSNKIYIIFILQFFKIISLFLNRVLKVILVSAISTQVRIQNSVASTTQHSQGRVSIFSTKHVITIIMSSLTTLLSSIIIVTILSVPRSASSSSSLSPQTCSSFRISQLLSVVQSCPGGQDEVAGLLPAPLHSTRIIATIPPVSSSNIATDPPEILSPS